MRNSERSRESYLLVDHRASPGLPEDFARRQGYIPELVREGKVFEAATLTCAHCRTVVIKNPDRLRDRGRCNYCDAYVCDGCAVAMRDPNYVHLPWTKRVDEHMDREARPDPFILPPILR
jgi:hypothetical protein